MLQGADDLLADGAEELFSLKPKWVVSANVVLAYVVRNHYLVVHAFATFIHVYAVHEIHNSCRDPAFRHKKSRNFVVP